MAIAIAGTTPFAMANSARPDNMDAGQPSGFALSLGMLIRTDARLLSASVIGRVHRAGSGDAP
jgi:hypothetical protein